MRCKNHFSDVSSAVGVCASCLRERLLCLVDAESLARCQLSAPDDRHNSGSKHNQPPPIVFPSSVSPYISRRKSDASKATDDICDELRARFFMTPQVVPTASKKKSKFHMISNFFRSRSMKSTQQTSDLSSDPSVSVSNSGQIADRRKNSPLKLFPLDETSAYDGRRGKWFGSRNRGMSPDVWEGDSYDGSPSTSRTAQTRVKASPARRNVASGIGICLSPLMRPSPSRHWKGVGPCGVAEYSGQMRSTVKPHLSIAASLRANRSKKLADLGMVNLNH